jgi:hypothetical protein
MSFDQNFASPTTAWEQGAVVISSSRDDDEIAAREEIARDLNSTVHTLIWPQVPSHNDDIYSIFSGEPVFRLEKGYSSQYVKDTDFQGLSSLNGLYTQSSIGVNSYAKREVARRQVRSEMTFLGLARNDAIYDAHDLTRSNNKFATMIGGIKTTVNTGDKNITHGDLIYWDLPGVNENGGVDKQRESIPGVEDNKILAKLLPFKYDYDTIEGTKTLLDIADLSKSSDNTVYDDDIPVNRIAKTFKKLVHAAFILGASTSKVNPDIDVSFMKDFLEGNYVTNFTNGKKTIEGDVQIKSGENFPLFDSSKDEVNLSQLSKYLLSTLLGSDHNPNVNKDIQDSGSELLISGQNVYMDFNKRIVGTAITSAQPGEQFDIRIGSYCL